MSKKLTADIKGQETLYTYYGSYKEALDTILRHMIRTNVFVPNNDNTPSSYMLYIMGDVTSGVKLFKKRKRTYAVSVTKLSDAKTYGVGATKLDDVKIVHMPDRE